MMMHLLAKTMEFLKENMSPSYLKSVFKLATWTVCPDVMESLFQKNYAVNRHDHNTYNLSPSKLSKQQGERPCNVPYLKRNEYLNKI